MAAKRRQIQMNGQEQFKISMVNPNAGAGLPGCACGSYICPPPYAVFPTRLHGGRRAGFVSVSLACVKKAVIKYERGDEVQNVGNVREGENVEPGKVEPIEGSTNPYFQTGVDPSARPLHQVQREQVERDQAAAEGDADGVYINGVTPHYEST